MTLAGVDAAAVFAGVSALAPKSAESAPWPERLFVLAPAPADEDARLLDDGVQDIAETTHGAILIG